jgi:hypothetical protein
MRGFYPECEQHATQVAPASRILDRLARFEAAKDRAEPKNELACACDRRWQRWKQREATDRRSLVTDD